MAHDNYGWLLLGPKPEQGAKRWAVVVDPTQGTSVLAALEQHQAALKAIWATHHHHDHVGGIAQVLESLRYPVEVLGSAHDVARCRIPQATKAVSDGDSWRESGLRVQALHVPGHTLGAMAYHVPECHAVFVGDTLFAAGCGRVFEGDAAMMWRSLLKLRALPEHTGVYCGHEYSEKNLCFALSLEPDLLPAKQALQRVLDQRGRGEPTVPTTLAQERRYNPFLRADEPALQQRLGTSNPEATFAALRSARDVF